MSLTIMTEIRIIRIVGMMLRTRGRAASPWVRRLSGMARALRRVRHDLECLPRPRGLGPEQQRASRADHAPGAIERALAQLEAEQAVAFERAGQRQLAGLGGRE